MRKMRFLLVLIFVSAAPLLADRPSTDRDLEECVRRLERTAGTEAGVTPFDQLARSGPAALPVLKPALTHPNPAVRWQVVLLLTRLDAPQDQIARCLASALDDADDGVRNALVYHLERLGPVGVSALREALDYLGPRGRATGYPLLARQGKSDQDVPRLVAALRDEDHGVRKAALQALAILGPKARRAAPALVDLLYDPGSEIAEFALKALVTLDSLEAVPALLEQLACDAPWRVDLAAKGLARVDPEGNLATPILVEALRQARTEEERDRVFALLTPFGSSNRAVLPELARYVGSSKTSYPLKQLLAAIGPDAHVFVPQLLVELEQGDWSWSLLFALEKITPNNPAIVDSFSRCKSTDKWQVVRMAVKGYVEKFSELHYLPGLLEVIEAARTAEDRQCGLTVLAWLGPEAGPALRRFLREDDESIRKQALEALLKIETEWSPEVVRRHLKNCWNSKDPQWVKTPKGFTQKTLPSILSCMDDPDPEVCAGAFNVLAWQPPKQRDLQAYFRKALDDPNGRVAAAINALSWTKQLKADDLLPLLEHQAVEVYLPAVVALAGVDVPAFPATPAVLRLARRADPEAQQAIRAALVHIQGATSWLCDTLDDPDPRLRVLAATALGQRNEKGTVPRLLPLIKDRDDDLRRAAALALAELDPQETAGLPTIVELLYCEGRQREALEALKKLGPRALPALPMVLEVGPKLRHANSTQLVECLSSMGEGAIPQLQAAMADEEREYIADRALRQIQSPAAAAVWIELLQSVDQGKRYQAIVALGMLGAHAHAALPTLLKVLREDKPILKREAAITLGKIARREDADVFTALQEALTSKEATVSQGAREALIGLGKRHGLGITYLRPLLDESTFDVPNTRIASAWEESLRRQPGLAFVDALAALGRPSVNLILARLRDPRPVARQDMLKALEQWPKEASLAPLVPDLVALAQNDHQHDIRESAASFLAKRREAENVMLPLLFNRLRKGLADKSESGLTGWMIAQYGPVAVPEVVAVLRTDFGGREREVLGILKRLGLDARSALPALSEMHYQACRVNDPWRYELEELFDLIQPEPAAPARETASGGRVNRARPE